MGLTDALRQVEAIQGWDWSRLRDRMDPLGWSYPEVLAENAAGRSPALDVGTGGGEVFSAVARAGDVGLDIDPDSLALARRRLPCPVVRGDQWLLPLRDTSIAVVADRHVGANPPEVLRVLRPGGVYVAQLVGGNICQNIFDAFGWGSNQAFWSAEFASMGKPWWSAESMCRFYADAGCDILRREEAVVGYEFLDEESLAFWLANAPLPEKADPNVHAEILERLQLRTNWHSELLVVRRAS